MLLAEDNKVLCHYFKEAPERAPGEYKNIREVYQLMRETPELGESFLDTLHRGLGEEFGAKGEVISFLGSQEARFKGTKYTMCKTTLYFLVRLVAIEQHNRPADDIESQSEIVRLSLDECIEKMEKQWQQLRIPTLNEAEIVRRAQAYLYARI